MANNIDLPKDKEIAKQVVQGKQEIDKINAEKGFLGYVWGNHSHASSNIAGLVIILLVVSGFVYFLVNDPNNASTPSVQVYWGIISPIITLSLGYLFGAHKSKKIEGE
ncbi:MAG: hypothetical protein R2811_00725 [Flavobacteriales bacterium]